MTTHNLKDKLIRYIDAGFPIIYINTFEETKADEIIRSISGGREVLEWNETDGCISLKSENKNNLFDLRVESSKKM